MARGSVMDRFSDCFGGGEERIRWGVGVRRYCGTVFVEGDAGTLADLCRRGDDSDLPPLDVRFLPFEGLWLMGTETTYYHHSMLVSISCV